METLPTTPGTHLLEPRDYFIPAQTVIPSGVHLIGVPVKTRLLPAGAPDGWSYHITGDDVQITGMILAAGGGIFIDRTGGVFNSGIVIDNNEFRINPTTGAQKGQQLGWSTGLRSSRITNNLFTGGPFGIFGTNYAGLVVSNNEFVDLAACCHIDALASGCGNLLVEQNYMKGSRGMGLEFQSAAVNLIYQDNWFEKPTLSTTASKNTSSMAFSLILSRSSKIKILRNVVIAPERPDGIGCRIGFEVGGDDTLVEDNYVNGINHVLAVNDGEGTCSVTAQNNRFMNFLEKQSISFPSSNPPRTFKDINNTPTTILTTTMETRIAAGARPQRNVRYGQPIPPIPPANCAACEAQLAAKTAETELLKDQHAQDLIRIGKIKAFVAVT